MYLIDFSSENFKHQLGIGPKLHFAIVPWAIVPRLYLAQVLLVFLTVERNFLVVHLPRVSCLRVAYLYPFMQCWHHLLWKMWKTLLPVLVFAAPR